MSWHMAQQRLGKIGQINCIVSLALNHYDQRPIQDNSDADIRAGASR